MKKIIILVMLVIACGSLILFWNPMIRYIAWRNTSELRERLGRKMDLSILDLVLVGEYSIKSDPNLKFTPTGGDSDNDIVIEKGDEK